MKNKLPKAKTNKFRYKIQNNLTHKLVLKFKVKVLTNQKMLQLLQLQIQKIRNEF